MQIPELLKQRKIQIALVVLLVLLYFPLFLHLGRLPLRIWDEARLAINAVEMHFNNNFLVTYYNLEPEIWNTKPPVMIWLQTLMIKIFGINEISIRLPSAIAALLTCLLLVVFSIKYFNSFWFGFIASLVLVTSNGYINFHGTRGGDYDALLTLFMTGYCLSFYGFTETGKNKFLNWFFLLLTLAIMTKGVQGLFFLPSLGIYYILRHRKSAFEILGNTLLWRNLILLILFVSAYYIVRNAVSPGYFSHVIENELGGRFLEAKDSSSGDYLYYIDLLINHHFTDWYIFIIPAILIGLAFRDLKNYRVTVFIILNLAVYLLIVSKSQTKHDWYHLPVFPLLAILCAVFINYIFEFLSAWKSVTKMFKANVVPFIFLILIFMQPYIKIIDKVYDPGYAQGSDDEKYYRISFFLEEIMKDKSPNRNYDICFDGRDNSHIMFYGYLLKEKGKSLVFRDVSNLSRNNRVIASQKHIQEYIERNYQFEIIETYYDIKTYRITGRV